MGSLFDVYNVNGDVNYAPNGEYTGTFTSNDPNPTLTLDINNADQAASAMLVSGSHLPAWLGETANQFMDAVGCALDIATYGKFSVATGLASHVFKIIDRYYKYYDRGNTAITILQDLKTGKVWAAVVEGGKSVLPFSSCPDALKFSFLTSLFLGYTQ